MCAEGRACVKPAAPHTFRHLLGKNRRLRTRLLRFAAYRRGGTHEHCAPSSKLLLGCRGLPRENALAVTLYDEIGCNVARGAAIDARGVDVPVARCRVRIAGRLHPGIGLLVLSEFSSGG